MVTVQNLWEAKDTVASLWALRNELVTLRKQRQ